MQITEQKRMIEELRYYKNKMSREDLYNFEMYEKRTKDDEDLDRISFQKLKEIYSRYVKKKSKSDFDHLFKKKIRINQAMRTDKHQFEKSYNIGGIDCPVCASEVEKELLKIDGVLSANVDLNESKVSLVYQNPDLQKNIERTIIDLGLHIQKEGSKNTTVLYIEGMDCSNEEQKIRSALKDIKEIEHLSFDLINHRLTIIHQTQEGKILKRIKELGFNTFNVNNKLHLQSKEQSKKLKQLGFLIIASLLALIGMVIENIFYNELISFVLFITAILIGGYKVLIRSFNSLIRLRIDIDVLMSIAILGALIINKYAEAAVVMILYVISLHLENFSIEKAKTSLKRIIALIPEISTIKQGNEYKELPTREIKIGDKILIKPGERFPVDGVVIDGHSTVDQSAITGESRLIAKIPGDICYAGTINKRGTLLLEATTTYKDSQFSKIISLLEKTSIESKSSLQRFVDKFAKYYTPLVVFLAAIIFIYSYFFLQIDFNKSLYRGLVLLVISCPCALVISTPVAVLTALARSTKFGALIKGGLSLENLHRIDAIAFDKTGTLTEGKFQIEKIIPLNSYDEKTLLDIAYNLEIHSEHSIANAIINYAKNHNFEIHPIKNFKVNDGFISGVYNQKLYFIGQPKLFLEKLNDDQKELIYKLENEGYTVIILFEEDSPLGLICLIDTLRQNIRSTINELKNFGLKDIYILSGDNKNIVEKIAKEIDAVECLGELTPEQKLKMISSLKKKHKLLAMVGDGLNDAPALKQAQIGIAMGNIGTDAAIESADIVLIGDDLSKLPKLLLLSRETVNKIKSNIALAIGIKFIFIVLSALDNASMWGAIFADMGSSIIVIFNSLRLLKFK